MPSKPEGFLIGQLDTNFPHSSGERLNQAFLQVGSKVLPSGSWLTENVKSGNSNRKNTGKYGPILKAFMQKLAKSMGKQSKSKTRKKQIG